MYGKILAMSSAIARICGLLPLPGTSLVPVITRISCSHGGMSASFVVRLRIATSLEDGVHHIVTAVLFNVSYVTALLTLPGAIEHVGRLHRLLRPAARAIELLKDFVPRLHQLLGVADALVEGVQLHAANMYQPRWGREIKPCFLNSDSKGVTVVGLLPVLTRMSFKRGSSYRIKPPPRCFSC